MRLAQDPASDNPRGTATPRPAARSAVNPPPDPAGRRGSPGWAAYLRDPRSAVLFFLASAFLIGGGRKGLQALRARRVVAAITSSNPDPADVEAAADHGRAGLIDLFRLLGTADRPEVRDAAGRALARLWKLDELIAEEEKAVVRRGFTATWQARRTYPRGLRVPITMAVDFGVPFLRAGDREVGPANLAWSYRITGTERARLEEWTDSAPGFPSATFTIVPDDFATLGPHRLVLHARVKTVGLTDAWELDLPHLPFSFEFDPNLTVGALLTLPDDVRGARISAAVRLEPASNADDSTHPMLDLTPDLVLRDPPLVAIIPPLPCDLAHRLGVEIEGIPGTWGAGTVVAVAAGMDPRAPIRLPLSPIAHFPPNAIDRPGPYRLRAILTADPDLGWVHPDIRSIWPGDITTNWVDVRVIRR